MALSPVGLAGSRGGTGCRGLSGRNVADSVSAIPSGHSRGASGGTRFALIDSDTPASAGELGHDVADEGLDLPVPGLGPATHQIAEPGVAPLGRVPPCRLE